VIDAVTGEAKTEKTLRRERFHFGFISVTSRPFLSPDYSIVFVPFFSSSSADVLEILLVDMNGN
jgi:hypothetical protein